MQYNILISSIRGLCALMVFGYHLSIDVFNYGYLGVDIFLVLSGFLVGGPAILNIKNGTFQLPRYVKHRLYRLLPTIISGLLLSLILGYFLLLPIEYVKLSKAVLSSIGMFANYFYSATSGYFDVEPYDQPLLHFWSLSLELQFYSLIALASILTKNQRSLRYMSITFVISLIASLFLFINYASNGQTEAAHFHFESRVHQFLIGVFVFLSLEKLKNIKSSWYAITLLLLMIIATLAVLNSNSAVGLQNVIVSFMAGILIILAIKNTSLKDNPALRILDFFGKISYQLYVFHFIIIAAASQVLDLTPYITFFIIAITILISWAQYQFDNYLHEKSH